MEIEEAPEKARPEKRVILLRNAQTRVPVGIAS